MLDITPWNVAVTGFSFLYIFITYNLLICDCKTFVFVITVQIVFSDKTIHYTNEPADFMRLF